MSFEAPHLLWLALLAPLAAAAAAWLWQRRLRADAAWAARGLWDRLLPAYSAWRLTLSVTCVALAVLGVALALARPRWGGTQEKVERRGVDVVFLLDSSLSMSAPDVAPSRLFVAKTLVRRLSQQMPGDRVALVQTEGEGMMLAPLTLDGAVLDLLLDTVEAGSLPRPGTELASGIDTALRLFGPQSQKHRALVLLSDGEDHGGGLEAAVSKLKESGVVVFALGIGTPDGSPIPLSDGTFKHDQQGEVVVTRLHEDNLESLTRATGGSYLRVTSAATDPAPILHQIDRLEKRTLESETVTTKEERFQWPLALTALALLLQLAVGPFSAAGDRRRPAFASRPRAVVWPLAVWLVASPLALPLPFNLWHPHLPAWAERWLYNPGERTKAAIDAAGHGDPKGAVGPADTALRLAPDSPLVHYNAGTAHLAGGDQQGAIPLLDQAAKGASSELLATANYNLGNARLAANDYAGAVEAYKQALRSAPMSADAKFNLELALAEQRKQAEKNPPKAAGPRGGGGRPRQGDQQHTPGQGGNGEAGNKPQNGDSQQRAAAQQQGPQAGQNGEQQNHRPGANGLPQLQNGQQPLPGYKDQPEMSAQEAAAVLQSVQNMERQQRRVAAARLAHQSAANGKDW